MKIHHFNGIYQERWGFSWAMLVSGRVTLTKRILGVFPYFSPPFKVTLAQVANLAQHRNWVFPKNNGTPKSSMLIWFSIINHQFWGFSPYFWFNTHIGE